LFNLNGEFHMPGFGVRRFIGKGQNMGFYGRGQLPDFSQTLEGVTEDGSREPEGLFPIYGVGRGGYPYGGGRGRCYGGGRGRRRGNRW
jgi:hypothetical protein